MLKDKRFHLDIIAISLVFIGFLASCSTPKNISTSSPQNETTDELVTDDGQPPSDGKVSNKLQYDTENSKEKTMNDEGWTTIVLDESAMAVRGLGPAVVQLPVVSDRVREIIHQRLEIPSDQSLNIMSTALGDDIFIVSTPSPVKNSKHQPYDAPRLYAKKRIVDIKSDAIYPKEQLQDNAAFIHSAVSKVIVATQATLDDDFQIILRNSIYLAHLATAISIITHGYDYTSSFTPRSSIKPTLSYRDDNHWKFEYSIYIDRGMKHLHYHSILTSNNAILSLTENPVKR